MSFTLMACFNPDTASPVHRALNINPSFGALQSNFDQFSENEVARAHEEFQRNISIRFLMQADKSGIR